jgi:surface antigen
MKHKLYAKENKLRFRKVPDTSLPRSIIKELRQGSEMLFVDGPWIRVKIGSEVGWVHGDYVSEEKIRSTDFFTVGTPHLHGDARTKEIRTAITDMYGGEKNGWELQCTEYVTYRVKMKLGIDITWPVTSGRHGGRWGAIFSQYKTYHVSTTPKVDCAMSFTTGISTIASVNDIGHVAFVEAVHHDGSITISEANWPRNGIYNERVLSKVAWKDTYKAQFIHFT